MEKKKRTYNNYIKKIKHNFNPADDGWTTEFFLKISSKAVFGLSDQAFKMYIFLMLLGDKKFTSMSLLAKRMKKSERQVQRIAEELKEKNFLKLVRFEPKKYQWLFDINGNLDKPIKEQERRIVEEQKEIEAIYEQPTKDEIEKQQDEQISEINKLILEKAKTIVEYPDFAILANKYWEVDDQMKEKIKEIIIKRLSKEPENARALTWFMESQIKINV